jgi:hypothetical protein
MSYQRQTLDRLYKGRMRTKRLRKKLYSRPEHYFAARTAYGDTISYYSKLLKFYYGDAIVDAFSRDPLPMFPANLWQGGYVQLVTPQP